MSFWILFTLPSMHIKPLLSRFVRITNTSLMLQQLFPQPSLALLAKTLILTAIILSPCFLHLIDTCIPFFNSAKGISFPAFVILVLSSTAKIRVFSSFTTLPLYVDRLGEEPALKGINSKKKVSLKRYHMDASPLPQYSHLLSTCFLVRSSFWLGPFSPPLPSALR